MRVRNMNDIVLAVSNDATKTYAFFCSKLRFALFAQPFHLFYIVKRATPINFCCMHIHLPFINNIRNALLLSQERVYYTTFSPICQALFLNFLNIFFICVGRHVQPTRVLYHKNVNLSRVIFQKFKYFYSSSDS